MPAVSLESLLPGDRIPDARLHAEGSAPTLHSEFAGTPLWLVRVSAGEALPSLPPVPEGVTALCLGEELPRDLPGRWHGYRAEAAWLECFATGILWEADSNLRLQAGHALPLANPPSQPGPARNLDADSLRGVAPVLQIPGVFEPEFCQALIAHLNEACAGGETSKVRVLERGGETLQLDPNIKLRRESPPRDPALEARMHERLMRRALPESARVFNFQVTRRDPFKLLAYPDGAGYFRAHRDNETRDVAHRRFALSVNLNEGQYAGGEFRFAEFGPHRYSPATGAALVFSCSLLHEVLPVERGTRYAATTFLY